MCQQKMSCPHKSWTTHLIKLELDLYLFFSSLEARMEYFFVSSPFFSGNCEANPGVTLFYLHRI